MKPIDPEASVLTTIYSPITLREITFNTWCYVVVPTEPGSDSLRFIKEMCIK